MFDRCPGEGLVTPASTNAAIAQLASPISATRAGKPQVCVVTRTIESLQRAIETKLVSVQSVHVIAAAEVKKTLHKITLDYSRKCSMINVSGFVRKTAIVPGCHISLKSKGLSGHTLVRQVTLVSAATRWVVLDIVVYRFSRMTAQWYGSGEDLVG